jgi:hypothetical protein
MASASLQSGVPNYLTRLTPRPSRLRRALLCLVAGVLAPHVSPGKGYAASSGTVQGELVLDSRPSGAAIYLGLDGIGATPLQIPLAPGKYPIAVRQGRKAWDGEVTIKQGETKRMVVDLREGPAPGQAISPGDPPWVKGICTTAFPDKRNSICGSGSGSAFNPARAHAMSVSRALVDMARNSRTRVKAMLQDDKLATAPNLPKAEPAKNPDITDMTLTGSTPRGLWISASRMSWTLVRLEPSDRQGNGWLEKTSLSNADKDRIRSALAGVSRSAPAVSVIGVGTGKYAAGGQTHMSAEAQMGAIASAVCQLAMNRGVVVKAMFTETESSLALEDVAKVNLKTIHFAKNGVGLSVDSAWRDHQAASQVESLPSESARGPDYQMASTHIKSSISFSWTASVAVTAAGKTTKINVLDGVGSPEDGTDYDAALNALTSGLRTMGITTRTVDSRDVHGIPVVQVELSDPSGLFRSPK